LEVEYKYGRYNKSLKSTSVAAYVSGISTLSKKLGCSGNGIYDISDAKELKILQVRIKDFNKATKDERSHFSAFLKFKGVLV